MGKGGDILFGRDVHRASGSRPWPSPLYLLMLPSFSARPTKLACLPRFGAQLGVYNTADLRQHQKFELVIGKPQ